MRAGMRWAVAAAVFAASGAASGQSGPSFNCGKATAPVEKAICSDRETSAADRTMAADYARLLASLTNPAARAHLQRDQSAWLADRIRLCPQQLPAHSGRLMSTCLTTVIAMRAERLATLPRGNAYPFVGERRLVERGRRGAVPYDITVGYAVFEFGDIDYGRANAVIKAWVDEYAGYARPPTQTAPGGPNTGWFLESSHVVHGASRELVTVAAHWLIYSGGAHPNNGRTAWHVELTTGRLLTLDDILNPASGWRDGVTQLVQADLRKQFAERPGSDDALELAALRNQVVQAHRWVFTADNVVLTFNPYEVGPYAAGPYDVELSYASLAPYIRNDGPLSDRAK